MSWSKPFSGWHTADQPFTTSTGVIRLTILDTDNNSAREVTVGDLLVSRERDDAKDKTLMVAGGLLIGRRTAQHLPASLSSRVLSRSHVQFLLGNDGNVFVADLGSLHGTKIENYGSIGRHSLLQLLDGDVLVLGKEVESKNYNHRPTRIRVNLRYPQHTALRRKPDVADMASKPKLQDVAQALGLLTAVRRRGYGLDESLLYLSESEEPLPRGESTPPLFKSQKPDDDIQEIDTTSPVVDDDSVVFLAESTPSKVVNPEAAPLVGCTDDTATPPLPSAFNVSPPAEAAGAYDDCDSLDIESIESYPIKFIPSSFPEDDAASVDGSEQQDMLIDHSDEEGPAHINEDVQYPLDEYVSDDGHDANETFFEPKHTPGLWQWDSEHEQSDDEADSDHELCAKSDGSVSNSDNEDDEDDEEDEEDENESENDSEDESDNDSEHASSDDASVSHADALEADAVWPPSHIFSFHVPPVLPEAATYREPQNDTRDTGTSFTDSNSFVTSKSAQPSFNPFALASFPPSPPLSTGADSNAADDNHEISTKVLGALMAKGLAANARAGTKRAFDEIATDEAITSNKTIDVGTNPSPVTAPEPAPAHRPSKIARYMRNAGFVAAGMAIGSIGTIAGLLRMAAD